MGKPNILDVSPMGIYPPRNGGHLRIYNLNLELSNYYNIFSFSQGIRRFELKFPIKPWITKINENYIEYRYINTPLLILMGLITDYGMLCFNDQIHTILNSRILKQKVKECDIIQVHHPWQFKYIYDIKPENTPIILNGQNVEYDLFKQTMKMILSKKLLNIIREKEKFALENADIIFMVSEGDKNRIQELYGVSKSEIHVIPNGTNISKTNIPSQEERENLKIHYGFEGKVLILFTGSKHLPNIEAIDNIISIAKKINNDSNNVILVAGRCGDGFKNKKYEKIVFTGYVDNMDDYFKMSNIAINPMLSGSGTNIKLLEYMAYGLPIITTEIGARGLDIENKKHAIVCDINEFPYWIEELSNNKSITIKLGANARKLAEEKYDWKIIAEKINNIYKQLV